MRARRDALCWDYEHGLDPLRRIEPDRRRAASRLPDRADVDYRPDRGSDYLSLAAELVQRLGRLDLLPRLAELGAELVPAGARG